MNATLGDILRSAKKPTEPAPVQESNYQPTEQLLLSPYAVELLEIILLEYDPEPAESDLCDKLLAQLAQLKHPT